MLSLQTCESLAAVSVAAWMRGACMTGLHVAMHTDTCVACRRRDVCRVCSVDIRGPPTIKTLKLPTSPRRPQYVFAATARQRAMNKEAVGSRALPSSLPPAGTHVGIMFGRESSGLTNEEVALANATISVDADPAFPVLNLAQVGLGGGASTQRHEQGNDCVPVVRGPQL